MEHKQTYQLEHAKISSLLLKFAIPATVGTFMNSIYNVVDRIYIGQGIGADGLAAAMVAFPPMVMVMAVGMLIGFGTNALLSIRLGEKNVIAAEELLGQAILLFLIFSIAFTALGLIFLKPMLRMFGASEQVLPLAIQYTRIIMIGVLFHEISFGVNNFIRGEGSPRIAMITMIVGAGLNIILDPIFIFTLHMGMQGAAIATVLAQFVSSFWVMQYYFSGKSVLKIHMHNFRINYQLTRRVFIIGSPPFFMNIANVFILAFVNNALKHHGGDLAIAVMGVIFTIYTINFMPVIGASQGAQPIIGYNHGAKNFQRVKDTLILSIKIVTAFCISATILIWMFPKFTFIPFSRGNSDLIELGTHAVRITMSMFPFVGFMVIVSNYFQATARPHISLFLSMLRQVLILIPLVLVLPNFMGLDGIWFAYPISAAGSFLMSAFFFFREEKALNLKIKSTNMSAQNLSAQTL